MNLWLVAFITFDILLTTVIIVLVLRRKVSGGMVLGVDFARLSRFADSTHAMVGEYMRANYNGHSESLPGVLGPLLDKLEQEAKAQGLDLGRDVIKTVMMTSVTRHNAARYADVKSALSKVA